VKSVQVCTNFIKEVKSEMLAFDLRNSPLRRKFDGIKYAERRCENILYELSFARDAALETSSGLEPEAKRQRRDEEETSMMSAAGMLDADEWQELRKAYKEYDQKRELVIKECRDVQKGAKQAIYAAHRGDTTRAEKLIKAGGEGVSRIFESYIKDSPSLRFGSFNGALEELAEAQMFLYWLKHVKENQNDDEHTTPDASAASLLPTREQMCSGLLDHMDYLGALSDFTGEVGRVAVEAATRRDVKMVKKCLRVTFACHRLLATLPLSGKNNMKKIGAAKTNLRKIETIEYDLAVRFGRKGPSIAALDDDIKDSGEKRSRNNDDDEDE